MRDNRSNGGRGASTTKSSRGLNKRTGHVSVCECCACVPELCTNPVVEELRSAMRRAANELGVPQPGYPAPVANAANILRAALGDIPPAPDASNNAMLGGRVK